MNKNCFRLIFNKARGMIMAVAETASSYSNAAGQTGRKQPVMPSAATTIMVALRPLTFGIWAALGMVLSAPLLADIYVDPNAPSNQQPTVLETANGVPQVNIQTASAGGVSRNTFTQFDVDEKGVILNNSRTDVQTELAGWVSANPWLANGEAKIILNEVNASNPSQLLGYIEVAGGKAQVIIANAAGITCDGCGFINASHATLTTGTVGVTGGELSQYTIQSGTIRIEGSGLDARDTDYTELMARAVQVNAGIWANNLKVTAGANQIEADTGARTSIAGTNAKPVFAVDVSKLGGMYAGQITLIGTDAGVGVRNAGAIGATAGEVVISADGMLDNSGQVSGSEDVALTGRTGVRNSGTVYAQSDLSLATSAEIHNAGTLAAQGNNSLSATGDNGRITSTGNSVIGAGITSAGELGATGDLTLSATQEISAQGQNLSGGTQTHQAQRINLSQSQTQGSHISAVASTGDVDLSKSDLVAQTLNLSSAKTVRTDQAALTADAITLTAKDVSNIGGQLTQLGDQDLTIAVAGTLDNTSGQIASNSKNLILEAAIIRNTEGEIIHAGDGRLAIDTPQLQGTKGEIATNGLLELDATSVTLDDGKLLAQQLDITTEGLSNRRGEIIQTGTGHAQITANGQLNNTDGTITSEGAASFQLGGLSNRGGKIQVLGEVTGDNTANLDISATGAVDNSVGVTEGGLITANGSITLSGASANNSHGTITAHNALTLTINGNLNNTQGVLGANQQVAATAAQLNNQQGTIGSVQGGVQLTATTQALNNTQGRIEADASAVLSGVGINNTEGVITGSDINADSQLEQFTNTGGKLITTGTDGSGSLTLATGELTNGAGLIQASGALDIDTHNQTLTNTHSGSNAGIIGQDSVSLTTGSLDNHTGYIGSKGLLSLNSGAIDNTQGGSLSSLTGMDIDADTLDNQGGQVLAIGAAAIDLSGELNNTNSLMRAGEQFNIRAASIVNTNTLTANKGIEAKALAITAPSINNQQGALRASEQLTLTSTGTVDNRQGLLSSGDALLIQDVQSGSPTLSILNTQGTVIAGESVVINTASLGGDGKLFSQGDLSITLVNDYLHTGELQANGKTSLTTSGTLTNTTTLISGEELHLNAATINNQQGASIESARVQLKATAPNTLNNRGLIDGLETFIEAITLNNLGTGRIYGDHLAIQAVTHNNDTEDGVAPVIAARERLDLGVHTLNNHEHALLFSAGDMAIGGTLDDEYHATGQADTINNQSATIESLGDMQLSAKTITNNNAHMDFERNVVTTEDLIMYEGEDDNQGVGIFYYEGDEDVYVYNDQSDYLHTPEGNYEQWRKYVFTRTTTEDQLISTDPARILAGGGMAINANQLSNLNSTIIAGSELSGTIGNLENNGEAGEGTKTIVDEGTRTNYWRDFDKGRDETASDTRSYRPPPTVEPLTLIPVIYLENTAPSGTGTELAEAVIGSLSAQPVATAPVNIALNTGASISPITEVTIPNPLDVSTPAPVVRTGGVNTQLPNNRLFQIVPNPNSGYLIETDPRFTNNREWLSSDYMLNNLDMDHAITQKRLGDGFYEQKLIREQIALLTGHRFLEGYADDEAQYRALMDNAATQMDALELRPGLALTAEQMTALTSDIVWLVEKTVTLPNGTTEQVWVPQVYVRVREGDVTATGSLIAANNIDVDITQELRNTGTLSGREVVAFTADTVNNLNGRITGNNIVLAATTDLNNLAGKIDATRSIDLSAGRDITIASTTNTQSNAQGSRTTIDRVAGLYVTGNEGSVLVNAGRNLVVTAADILNGAAAPSTATSTTASTGSTQLTAGHDITLGTLNESLQQTYTDDKNTHSEQSHTARVTNIHSQGDIQLNAGNNLNATGTQISATDNASLRAGHDINLSAAANQDVRDTTGKGTKTINDTTTHTLASITSGGDQTLNAGRDANLTGTSQTAGGDVSIAATRDTNIAAVVDSDYHYAYRHQDQSFGRSRTTETETLDQTVTGGAITSGGDVLINAHKGTDGKVITEASSNVNLVGVDIQAQGDAVIAADEDVNITGITYEELDYARTAKSTTGGFSKEDKGTVEAATLIQNANIAAAKNAQILAGNNINLAATNVLAEGNINLEAVDTLLITAGEVITNSQEWKQSSGMFTSGDVYNSKEHQAGESVVGTQASTLIAGGTISAEVGSATIIGSDLAAAKAVTIDSDMGNIDIKAAQTRVESYSYDKEVSVGFGDVVDSLKRPDQLIKTEDGRATVKLASATYDEVDTKTQYTEARGSTVASNGDIALNATAGAVNIEGSELIADADQMNGGDVTLAAATAVNIVDTTDTFKTSTKEVHGEAELSVVVQHQAVEVVKATEAVDAAKEQLEQAKKDYKAYERNLDQLQEQLHLLEADYNNKVAGVRYEDLLELRELIDDVKDDKEWYQAGVALAAVNLASSITALVQQTAAAAQSASTYGFNAGLQLDIDATKIDSTQQATTAVGSYVSGNNIAIRTGTNGDTQSTSTTIKGSHLAATDNIAINTGELNILASKNTTESTTETEHGHVTAQMTVYGASGGASVSGSYDRSKATDKTTTHNNSTLTADQIDLTTSGDANIRGANVHAQSQLTAAIDGDLNLESVQNRSNTRDTSMGISGGMSLGGTGANPNTVQGSGDVGSTSGVNGGLNASNGMSVTRETVLTSLTSGGAADITVKGNTQITSALLATVNEDGSDRGELNLNTGSLTYTDLRNTYQNSQTGGGISTSLGMGEDKANPRAGQTTAEGANGESLHANTSNLTYNNTQANSASKTLATLGHGNITVGGTHLEQNGEVTDAGKASDSPLIALNRDATNTEKELWDSEHGQTVDATLDHRLLSEDGRTQIKHDAVDTVEFGQDIGRAVSTVRNDQELGVTDFWTTLDNNTKATQIKNELTRNPEYAELLTGLKSEDGDVFAASFAELGHIAQAKFGLSPEEFGEIFLYSADNTTSTSLGNTLFSDAKGGTVLDKNNAEHGNLFVNADGSVKTDMLNTLGHETVEVFTLRTDGKNDATQEAQANAFGNQFSNRINQAVGGEIDGTSTTTFNTSLQNSYAVTQGTQRANVVGNAEVDNRRLRLTETQTLERTRIVISQNTTLNEEQKSIAQVQLNALACAAVKCASGIPTDDPLYAQLNTLQAVGEELNGQGITLDTVLGEETGGQFEHGLKNSVDDFLTAHDEGITRTVGTGQAVAGALGMMGGATLTAASGIGCGPSAGLACVGIPVGVGITVLSEEQGVEGINKAFGEYSHTEGQGVVNSFTATTHQGDVNPTADLAINAGIMGIELLTAKVGVKYLDEALDGKVIKTEVNNTSSTDELSDATHNSAAPNTKEIVDGEASGISQYDEYKTDPGPQNDSGWDWPVNLGFVGAIEKSTLPIGTRIDRYGNTQGSFLSPEGTDYSERALAPGTRAEDYTVYEVIKPLPIIRGEVAPAFGEKGGGIQILPNLPTKVNIDWLIKNKYIKVVN